MCCLIAFLYHCHSGFPRKYFLQLCDSIYQPVLKTICPIETIRCKYKNTSHCFFLEIKTKSFFCLSLPDAYLRALPPFSIASKTIPVFSRSLSDAYSRAYPSFLITAFPNFSSSLSLKDAYLRTEPLC